jgi:hypothetical protein
MPEELSLQTMIQDLTDEVGKSTKNQSELLATSNELLEVLTKRNEELATANKETSKTKTDIDSALVHFKTQISVLKELNNKNAEGIKNFQTKREAVATGASGERDTSMEGGFKHKKRNLYKSKVTSRSRSRGRSKRGKGGRKSRRKSKGRRQ